MPEKQLLPPYFREQEVYMAGDKNPLEAFLHSDYVVYPTRSSVRQEVFVPWKHFWKIYRLYCNDNSITFRRPDSNTLSVLRQYSIEYMVSRHGKYNCSRVYPRALKAPDNLRPQNERTRRNVKYLVGADVAACYAYLNRGFSSLVYCEHSRNFQPLVDYQKGGMDDSDEDSDDGAPETDWDFDSFMQRYHDRIGSTEWIANAPDALAFPMGVEATRKFYRDAKQHFYDIVHDRAEHETAEVTRMMDRLGRALAGESP